mmetsp:Transcript_7776/g.22988  ORF Transcript_7776/g.22988 Transcript_7776/m.22988 type:complete len:398 (-) Transcript_7776:5156-6349(-)
MSELLASSTPGGCTYRHLLKLAPPVVSATTEGADGVSTGMKGNSSGSNDSGSQRTNTGKLKEAVSSSVGSSAAVASSGPSCHIQEHAEYGGTTVKWGDGHLKDTAQECCAACRETENCNVWVWCAEPGGCGGDRKHRECWLKKQEPLNPTQPDIARQGPTVPWTSGAMYTEEQRLAAQKVFEDREAAEKMRLATLLANESLPLVYLDVSVKGEKLGRMVFVLFSDESPLQAENMRQLCTGERGTVPKGENREGEGLPYHIKGKFFYRIIDRFIDQTGADTESIYGGQFRDDQGGLTLKHDRRGLLSAANAGPDTNTSHFSILVAPAPHLNGHYTIFGELVEGWEVAARINKLSLGKKDNTVGREAGALITDSGELRRGTPIVLPEPYRSQLAARSAA